MKSVFFRMNMNVIDSRKNTCILAKLMTSATRLVPLVEQELPNLQKLPSSSPVLRGVRVARSLVL